MNTVNLITIFLFLVNLSIGQNDTIFSKENPINQSTYTWKGECCNNEGKPTNPGNAMSQIYVVKKFKSKTPIEINIKSVTLGSKTIPVNIRYQDKIEGDTQIIIINDTIGVKLSIAKAVENGNKKYLYRLQVFKKDMDVSCWRPLTSVMSYFDVYSQNMSINMFSIGYANSKDYFQIVEGWIKFND